MASATMLTFLGDQVCRLKVNGKSLVFTPGEQTDVTDVDSDTVGTAKIINLARLRMFAEIDPSIIDETIDGSDTPLLDCIDETDNAAFNTAIIHPPYN